jgi:hypothetical protein
VQPAEATVLKAEALRVAGTLNPSPERVADLLYRGHFYFDARDRVQVNYETLRCVE